MAKTGQDQLATVGPYRVQEQVSIGNFSMVYRALEPYTCREVALKIALTEGVDPRASSHRLWKEARIRAVVNHDHILPLYLARRSRNGSYLVGPWLSGGSLGDRFRHPVPLRRTVGLARALAAALDTLHAAGWVHCDLNPQNVVFDGNGRPMLIDLALARRVGERWRMQRGQIIQLELSPQMVPPEAWHGEPLDGRSDLYALGILLYRALTGTYPFKGDEPLSFREQHCQAKVTPPSDLNSSLGPKVDEVLLQSLAKSPAQRFATGADLVAALELALVTEGLIDAESRLVTEGDLSARRPNTDELWPDADEHFDVRALHRAGELLERFADSLDSGERRALEGLLGRLNRLRSKESANSEAQARREFVARTTQLFALPAAMFAFEGVGAAEALAGGPRKVVEIAAACEAPERTITKLLEVLVAAGLVNEEGGRFSLPAWWSRFYQHSRQIGLRAAPVRKIAKFWNHLSDWARTGEPYLRMDVPDGSGYAPGMGQMRELFAEQAKQLADFLRGSGRLPQRAAILDIGAGSAVWSLAMAEGDPRATITAVDRPAVLEIVRTNAAASGMDGRLTLLPGDWRDVELPRSAFDVVLVANLCHLEDANDTAALIARLEPTLCPGGSLVIVDIIPRERRQASLEILLQTLRLALRTPRGDLHDLVSFRHWLSQAGLSFVEVVPLDDASEGHFALLAQRSTRGLEPDLSESLVGVESPTLDI